MYLTCSALVITILLAVAKILVLHIKVHRSIARLKGDACEKINMQAGGRTSDLMILSSVCSCSKTHIISSGVAQPLKFYW